MMKKFLLVLLTICMLFSFMSCKDEVKPPKQEEHVIPEFPDISRPTTQTDWTEYIDFPLESLTSIAFDFSSMIEGLKQAADAMDLTLEEFEDFFNEHLEDEGMVFELSESQMKLTSTEENDWFELIEYTDGRFEFRNQEGTYILLNVDWSKVSNATTEPFINNLPVIPNCFALNTFACVPTEETCAIVFDFMEARAEGKNIAQIIEEFVEVKLNGCGYEGSGSWIDGNAFLYQGSDGTHDLIVAYVASTKQFAIVITIPE